jgi:K+-transporting ATPase ATPase C chain
MAPQMLREIRPALVVLAALTLVTGIAYPLAMAGLARLAFPWQASGSLVERDGKVVGSARLGQSFTVPGYFHGRPSATSAVPYNAAASGGSNLGPTAKPLVNRVKGDINKLRAENPGQPIPGDLVTTSASGLDPHISPEAALFQVPRVARARNLPEDLVRALVERHTEGRLLGLLGEPRVNVLALNLALDRAAPR